MQAIFTFTPRDLTTAFDLATPFLPGWVWIYLGSYVFWILVYLIPARHSETLACKLCVADFIGKMICLVFFLALPTTNVRPSTEGAGLSMWLMKLVYAVDSPSNLFPSMHCFIAWMGSRYIWSCKDMKQHRLVSLLCFIGCVLVFLSTLYTKQHVVWDVLGAVAVAELSYWIAEIRPLASWVEKYNQKVRSSSLFRKLYSEA